jgi:hypothetical protein
MCSDLQSSQLYRAFYIWEKNWFVLAGLGLLWLGSAGKCQPVLLESAVRLILP